MCGDTQGIGLADTVTVGIVLVPGHIAVGIINAG